MLKLESANARLPFSSVPLNGPDATVVVGVGLGLDGPVVRVEVGEGEAVGETVGRGEVVGDGEVAGEAVGVGEVVGLGDVVGLGERVGVGDVVGRGEVVGVGEAVGVGVGVTWGTTAGAPLPGHVCDKRIPEFEFKIVAYEPDWTIRWRSLAGVYAYAPLPVCTQAPEVIT